MLEGVLGADDARRARDAGAVVVSNEGGQLDHVPSAISVLEQVDAVGDELEVLAVDGASPLTRPRPASA